MSTVTIPKTEYQNIIKAQVKMSRKLDLMQKIINKFVVNEVNSQYAKKLNQISAKMDKGKSVKFSSLKEMKKYLDNI